MGVWGDACRGMSVEHALSKSPEKAMRANSQRLQVLERMTCSNKMSCRTFNLKSKINVDLTPINLNQAEAAEDGDELGGVEEDGGFVNFSKFRDGHEVVVLVDFRAKLFHFGDELEAQ